MQCHETKPNLSYYPAKEYLKHEYIYDNAKELYRSGLSQKRLTVVTAESPVLEKAFDPL